MVSNVIHPPGLPSRLAFLSKRKKKIKDKCKRDRSEKKIECTHRFVGGELNACYNAVDRHVEAGNGEKIAIIYDSPQTSIIRKVTYNELLEKTSLMAGALADIGVGKGDKVVIYMPLIPETIITILAVARLGAIHSVVFGGNLDNYNYSIFLNAIGFLSDFQWTLGFAAKELASRIDHAKPKVVVIASCGLEPNKIIT